MEILIRAQPAARLLLTCKELSFLTPTSSKARAELCLSLPVGDRGRRDAGGCCGAQRAGNSHGAGGRSASL